MSHTVIIKEIIISIPLIPSLYFFFNVSNTKAMDFTPSYYLFVSLKIFSLINFLPTQTMIHEHFPHSYQVPSLLISCSTSS